MISLLTRKNTIRQNVVRCGLLLGLALAAGGALAGSEVVELQPDELADFIARHGRAVVQFTSPDRGCGFCIGADTKFDAAAALNKDDTLVFARVQWSPWRAFPISQLGYNLYAIPQQIVFRDGQPFGQIIGTQNGPEALLKQFAQIAETGSKVHFASP
ncbi:thioredoxin family protein [Pseudothauera nasutitermitis]|uniref:Thioredoxin family protein n=1 Tax=Pseudothauera nasutitermitis TaxID=2565930 RepID=A0A4S4AZ05_9RHOO|nr:thioredoxin family protein [Pseudothauera nasutitermitis]THF64581.1 thioredoxin family protein [Pseudothauera nasutitermitis]